MGTEGAIERFTQLLIDYGGLTAVDVQPPEEGLVHETAQRLVPGVEGCAVGVCRMLQEVEGAAKDVRADAALLGVLGKLPLDALALRPQAADLLPQLGLRPTFLARQVKEVVFLGVQFGQSAGELITHRGGQAVLVCDGGVNPRPCQRQLLWRQPDRTGVVVGYGGFHGLDRNVRLVANAILAAHTKEIVVNIAVPVFGALQSELPLAAVAE